jgi:aquaporin Z
MSFFGLKLITVCSNEELCFSSFSPIDPMKQYLAEFIGTYILVFCGTGAIVIDGISGGTVTHLGIAVTFGLVVTAVIYTYGHISGAHINPAVTIAFWYSGRIEAKKVIPYIIAQILGAICASFSLVLLFPEYLSLGMTLPSGSIQQSFFLEIFLTFFLMLVIIHVSSADKEVRNLAGLVIGFVVLLEALFAGPISGASMNPARSIGPAVASMHFQDLWVYCTAPVLGAVLSIVVFKFIDQAGEDQIKNG